MKKILWIASLLFLVTSCGGGDDSAPGGGGSAGGGGSNEYLNVNDIDIKGDSTTAVLSVKASGNCEWSITCTDSWVTSIVPAKGRGNSDVTITVPINPSSTDARKATITVSNTSGSIVRNIMLTQAAHAEYLTLSVDTLKFSNKQVNADVSISSNTHWTISGVTSWLGISKSEGDNNGIVTVSVSDNSTREDQKAVLKVRGSNIEQQLVIIQAAGTLPTVTVPQISNVDKDEARVTFAYESEFQVSLCGVCYGTSENPVMEYDSNEAVYVSGLRGEQTVKLSNLSPGIKYYVRAYAISAVGIRYSETVTFTTESTWPGENDVVTPN